MRRSIAMYGKGGIGKSTVSSNIAAVYGGEGLETLLVGCDPKSDTAINITGRRIRPLLDLMKASKVPDEQSFLQRGFNGVACIEIGGPEPGIGCAGRGLIIGINHLIERGIIGHYDVVIFDVPADIVCGGLAVVVKEGYANDTYIITSDDFMSLYAANNLCRGFKKLNVRASGIVYNRAKPEMRKHVEVLSRAIHIPIIGEAPDSDLIQRCSSMNKTVLECQPASAEAETFRAIATRILSNEHSAVPDFITEDALEVMRHEGS